MFIFFWSFLNEDFVQEYPTGSFNKTQFYEIDPQTILISLEDNQSDLFQIKAESSLKKIIETPISWSQADYNAIALKIHNYVWQEQLASWQLYRIIFSTSCHDNPKGFDYGDYIFFKQITYNENKMYATRGISITPQYGDITVGSDTNFSRPIWGWKHIDTESINVMAEGAMQLAEVNGGQNARLNMQNKCQIYVSMNPNGYGHSNWKVVYSGNSASSEFEIVIQSQK